VRGIPAAGGARAGLLGCGVRDARERLPQVWRRPRGAHWTLGPVHGVQQLRQGSGLVYVYGEDVRQDLMKVLGACCH